MKNLTNLLQKGNITPRDRVLFLVHDFVAEEKTGKGVLTEADKLAIGKSWIPKSNAQIREYNRYIGAWKTEGRLRIEANLIYLNGMNSLLLANRIIDFAMWRDKKNLGALEKLDLAVDPCEALDLVLKNSGLRLEDTIYRFAFQNLKEPVRERILEIYPDAATEREYLEEQEHLANLLRANSEIGADEKVQLANLIIAPLKKYSGALSNGNFRLDKIFLSTYFADLPLIEVAKKWSHDHGIICDDETLSEEIEEYCVRNGTSFEKVLRETVLSWIDEGLFVTEYAPICNSNQREVFESWIEEKAKAKTTIQNLIEKGSLTIESKNNNSLGIDEAVDIISGESLYYMKEDFSFAEEFKDQTDEMRAFGSIILFLKSRDFLEHYSILLGFSLLYEKLSEIYEVELGSYLVTFQKNFGEALSNLMMEMNFISEKFRGESVSNGSKFPFEFFTEDALGELRHIEPKFGKEFKRYLGDFSKDFGTAFKDGEES